MFVLDTEQPHKASAANLPALRGLLPMIFFGIQIAKYALVYNPLKPDGLSRTTRHIQDPDCQVPESNSDFVSRKHNYPIHNIAGH